MNHELNIGTINGLTVDNILDKMVERGIGIANPGVVFPTTPSLGALIDIGDHKYRIVEIDTTSGIVYVALAYWVKNVQWATDSMEYAQSIINNECISWYNNEVPQELKNKDIFIDVAVGNGAGKCFIPSKEQVYPDEGDGSNCFDFFRTGGGRIFRDETETTAYSWWTSTIYQNNQAWLVLSTGGVGTNNMLAPMGFRPTLAILISAFAQVSISA